MSDVQEDLATAAELPEGDIIRILLEQHVLIREIFRLMKDASGETKQQLFADLRALLAVHETAEEIVLRPVSRHCTGDQVADARNEEEQRANEVLSQLEQLDVDSFEFDTVLNGFEEAVVHHSDIEEKVEFQAVLRDIDAEQRRNLGGRLAAVEKVAPTRPHPGVAGSLSKEIAAGPFLAIVDRVKDALQTRSMAS